MRLYQLYICIALAVGLFMVGLHWVAARGTFILPSGKQVQASCAHVEHPQELDRQLCSGDGI